MQIHFAVLLLQLFVPIQGLSVKLKIVNQTRISEFYPESKRFGTRQSPINIVEGEYVAPRNFPDLNFHNYNELPEKVHLINRGHTLELKAEWPKEKHPGISGGPLPSRYNFDGLHFHWGSDNFCGSEHLLEEKSFPMEMHVVHKISGLDQNQTNSTSNSILVVSYFMILEFFSFFGPITNHIDAVLKPNTSIEINPFPLRKILPVFQVYFTYPGSLTTPPYSENVVWIISKIKLLITAEEIENFRRLLSHHHKPILSNYRNTQDLFDRPIYTVMHGRLLLP